MLALALFDQDRDKVFIGLEFDALLVPTQIHLKNMLIVWLGMGEREIREFTRQVYVSHTVLSPLLASSRTSVPTRSTALEIYDMSRRVGSASECGRPGRNPTPASNFGAERDPSQVLKCHLITGPGSCLYLQ
jgi:hypothetical protein